MHCARQIQTKAVRAALAVLSLALVLTGCVRVERKFVSRKTTHSVTNTSNRHHQHWLVFKPHGDGKDAVFVSEKLTLIFPNLSRRERNSFDGEDIAIQVAGEGCSEVTRTCNRNGRITTFNGRYKDGVSTITFGGREVKLADSARKVILGDKTINLANESPTVTVIAGDD